MPLPAGKPKAPYHRGRCISQRTFRRISARSFPTQQVHWTEGSRWRCTVALAAPGPPYERGTIWLFGPPASVLAVSRNPACAASPTQQDWKETSSQINPCSPDPRVPHGVHSHTARGLAPVAELRFRLRTWSRGRKHEHANGRKGGLHRLHSNRRVVSWMRSRCMEYLGGQAPSSYELERRVRPRVWREPGPERADQRNDLRER